MEKTKTSPLSFIKKWCYDKRLYFLVFFLPVAIMFSAYAFFKIHPIGDIPSAPLLSPILLLKNN